MGSLDNVLDDQRDHLGRQLPGPGGQPVLAPTNQPTGMDGCNPDQVGEVISLAPGWFTTGTWLVIREEARIEELAVQALSPSRRHVKLLGEWKAWKDIRDYEWLECLKALEPEKSLTDHLEDLKKGWDKPVPLWPNPMNPWTTPGQPGPWIGTPVTRPLGAGDVMWGATAHPATCSGQLETTWSRLDGTRDTPGSLTAHQLPGMNGSAGVYVKPDRVGETATTEASLQEMLVKHGYGPQDHEHGVIMLTGQDR